MELFQVKEIFKDLLIKKNNFKISKEDSDLLSELEFLLTCYNNLKIVENATECSCLINDETIKNEIEKNQCIDCGLPLSVL